MDSLLQLGVSKELSREEFLRSLRCVNNQEIAKLRMSLFEDAKANCLTHHNNQLVTRRKVGGGKSVVEKHIEDIWLLVCSIKNKSFVPRILLKNGKRPKEEFEQSQLSSSQTSIRAPCSSPSHQPLTCSSQVNLCRCSASLNYTLSPTVVKTSASANVTADLLNSDFTSESNQCSNSNPTSTNISSSNEFTSSNDLVFRSSVISDINLLKTAVSNLHRELHQLRIDGRKLVPQQSIESCLLYVRLNVNDVSSIGTPLLESVLSCDVQRYWLIGNWQRPTLKVKIIEPNLLKALTSGNKNGHYTSVWHKKVTPSIPKSSSPHICQWEFNDHS